MKDASTGHTTDQEIRTLLGGFGFTGDDVDKPVKVLSGGEKIRLAFARIFIRPPNLLLLDEPTTHLDIQGREALEHALQMYKGTVCYVSHDIEFVRNTANGIVSISEEGVRRWLGGYDDYLRQNATGPTASNVTQKTTASKPVADGKVRKETQKKIRTLERKLEKLEFRISELEEQQASELRKLELGEVEDFKTHQQNLNTLAADIQNTTRDWIDVGEEIETLQETL